MDKCCENCRYYEEFSGVCCNGRSIYAADFRDADDWCACWEVKEE